jgi:uncharacterized protein (AIM24 family)
VNVGARLETAAGPGEILIQTRNLQAFAGLLKPFFPSQGGGGGFNLGG